MDDKEEEEEKKEKPIKDKPKIGHLPPHLAEYYEAIERGDREGAVEAIKKNAEECPSRHGYCLSEVFCPECPLANGGLAVRSAREGWE